MSIDISDPREARKQAKKVFLSRSLKEVLENDISQCEKFSMGLSLVCPASVALRSDVDKHLENLEKNHNRRLRRSRSFNNMHYQQWLAKRKSKQMIKLIRRVKTAFQTAKETGIDMEDVRIIRT